MDIKTIPASDPFGSILTPAAIQSIMDSEGPTVQAVVLRSNGTIEQITYDSTPKKNMITEILQAPPTIIGEWDQLQVILVRGRFDDEEKVPINPHKLRFPFNAMVVYGDIFLYRVNDQAIPENFTKAQYEEFLSHSNEDTGKVWTDPFPASEEEMCQDTVSNETLFANIQEKLLEKFVEKHGRDPTTEELFTIKQTIQTLTGLNDGDDDSDCLSENDSDYTPEEDEDLSEEENIQVDEEDEEEHQETEDENKNWREKLNEAIDSVRSVAWADRQKVLSNATTTYESESGEKVDAGIVKQALDFLREKLMPTGVDKASQPKIDNEDEVAETEEADHDESDENQNENVDPNESAVAPNTSGVVPECEEVLGDEDEDEDEDEELETPLTEAEVQKEVREAFEHIRLLGAAHGREMAETIRQTFLEINGREPEFEELAKVFGRMKAQLAEEAGEEILETEVDDQSQKNTSAATVPKMDLQAELEEKQILVQYARNVVPQEMAVEATTKFQEATGKQPTQEELNQLLVTLATTPVVNADFGNDSQDEDYDPTQEDEKYVDEDFSVPLDPDELEIVLGSDSVPKRAQNPLPVNESLLHQAKNKFVKLNSRDPTDEEVTQLAKLITETKFAEAEFDSNDESDSDYVPEKDEESDDECPNLFEDKIETELQPMA